MSQQWDINPHMSQQWGEYMNLLATPGLPPCSNTDYLAGTSNPDFGAGTSNLDFGAETFAQRGAETSSEPALPDLNTQPTFYRSIQFFQQTFPEIPADSVDVPNLRAYIASLHLGHVKCNPSYGIKHVIQNVKDQTGYDVPYQKAWYNLKMAREIVYGTWESSVQKLPAYLGAIQKYNPGTIVEWKHKGLQASTAAMDGNQQVLPLAFAVVDEETYPSWKWFLQQLSRHVIEGRRGCALFLIVMPDSLKQFVKDLCWQAGSEYQLRKFNRIMDEIKKQDVKAFAYLDAINKEKWTASHDGGWRCGILTTNMSECINGSSEGGSPLPVSALVEITLERTVHYFHVRAMKGQKMLQNNQLWTDFACKMFISWQQKAVEHTVTKYSHAQQSASVVTRRQGRHGMNTHVVKIANRECSCGKWNQFGIPCSHAQKVCGAYNISVASMVKDYYDVMAYNNTYSKHFEPGQSEDYWDDPNFQLVHDPTIRTVTRPGRNQTTRIHNEMDWRQTRARQEAQQQQGDSSIQENVP
ncbi:hypothetical protein Sango_0985300 [Sesamum angolense]|uniref:SWIM-type domain-containing protein n=1 Tax=Sesamum angolense TaxID=2727404 RepID=A0AAE1WZT0_9LAMI|nr:hypothetical protein Sango_0985300 [Sesamum angolense]